MLCHTSHSGFNHSESIKSEASTRSEADGAPAEETIIDDVQQNLKRGWTAHVGEEGRIYYCNHLTKTSSWLPPSECWEGGSELPYGWEKAVDSKGIQYFINHVNKTTTYVAPVNRSQESPPQPRDVVLEKSSELGFGFVAGSEKPVVVRFVTENSPSVGKLEPGDEIWCVNGEDVRSVEREHVIAAVRACSKSVCLRVCQPSNNDGGRRRGALLSPGKRAHLKAKPARVRFAESVQVNGSPLYLPSAFSLSDAEFPSMANVLKVYLENGQTKSFKYDPSTKVNDVFLSLKDKLCIKADEYFSLVVEYVYSLRRNKLTILNPNETLAKVASHTGTHKMRCLFRVSFVPTAVEELVQKDPNTLDYFYLQCTNDVLQERFAPELQPDMALRLAALHIHQHALDNHFADRLSLKDVEKEFGLERFVPCSFLESMKRKELRRVLAHFLKLYTQQGGLQPFTSLQAKILYLELISSLPSYGAKCFSSSQPERVLLVSPKFGLSQIIGLRSSLPQPIASIQELESLRLLREDELSSSLTIGVQGDRIIELDMEEKDATEMILVLAGYFKLMTGLDIKIEMDDEYITEDIAPAYLSPHNVVPAKWSYVMNKKCYDKTPVSLFTIPPPYHSESSATETAIDNFNKLNSSDSSGCETLERSIPNNGFNLFDKNETSFWNGNNGFDCNMDLSNYFESNSNDYFETKSEEILRRMDDMRKLVESSEKYLGLQSDMNMDYNGATNIPNYPLSDYESMVDQAESDTESNFTSDDTPGVLKHSDSLILLTESLYNCSVISNNDGKSANGLDEISHIHNVCSQSDSDTEYSYSPTYGKTQENNASRNDRCVSMPYYSNRGDHNSNVKKYDKESFAVVNECETEMIDLTLLPPPGTPDALDGCSVPELIPEAPLLFADKCEEKSSLDDFIAMVAISPPVARIEPESELTPEQLSSYIIPPPPSINTSNLQKQVRPMPRPKPNGEVVKGNLSVSEIRAMLLNKNGSMEGKVLCENVKQTPSSSEKNPSETYVIDYPTVQRKGVFSCCNNGDKDTTHNKESSDSRPDVCDIKPPPRRRNNPNEYIPSRPPKTAFIAQPRTRSNSFSNNSNVSLVGSMNFGTLTNKKMNYSLICEANGVTEPAKRSPRVPNLPPRNEHLNQPKIQAAPIKPPLPPAPSLEVLKLKKQLLNRSPTRDPNQRHATIGSPKFHRHPTYCKKIENEQLTLHNEMKNFSRKDNHFQSLPSRRGNTAVTESLNKMNKNSDTIKGLSLYSPQNQRKLMRPHYLNDAPVIRVGSSNLYMITSKSPVQIERNMPERKSSSPSTGERPTITQSISRSSPSRSVRNGSPFSNWGSPTKNHTMRDQLHPVEQLLTKNEATMEAILNRLSSAAKSSEDQQYCGGGKEIDESKFQKAKEDLTTCAVGLVCASRLLVGALGSAGGERISHDVDSSLAPCVSSLRRIADLSQDLVKYSSTPLQTRNLILRVHDVAAAFKEIAGEEMAHLFRAERSSAEQKQSFEAELSLRAECLANVLASLLRMLRVFTP